VTGIVRFYEWVYYRCYRYSKKADSRFSLHWAVASLYVQCIFTMNLGVLLFLFVFIFPAPRISGSRWVIFAALIAVALVHLLFLWHKNRYKRIISRFSNETAEQQQRSDRLFGWYLVTSTFSLLSMFVIAAALAGLH